MLGRRYLYVYDGSNSVVSTRHPIIALVRPVHFIKEVEQRARTPCLCIAGIGTILPVGIGQFRKSTPGICLDVVSWCQQHLVQVI